MKVKLISHTPEPEKLIATAARLCYSNKADIDTIMDDFTEKEISNFVNQLISTGHKSVLEHVTFSFAIEGISRVLSHEIVRHRIGVAISQRSQRYCSEEKCEFVYPTKYDITESSEDIFSANVCNSKDDYKLLLEEGVPKESARYVLPGATCTRMILTMNARELLHFFALRSCKRALPEMQMLANLMISEVKEIAPTLFRKAGPSCVQLGYCPEGSRSCGRYPTIEKLTESYNYYKAVGGLVSL